MKNKNIRMFAAVLMCAGLLTGCGSESSGTSGSSNAESSVTTSETQTTTTTASATSTESQTTAASDETTTTTAEVPTETSAPVVSEQQQEPVQTQAEPTQKKLIWDELKIGGSVTEYLSANKNYTNREEADSCMGEGKDIVYTYNDRVLMTYLENGKETLVEFDVTSADIPTRKGIRVGSTVAALQASYGPADDGGFYIYNTEDGILEFQTEGDKVSMIMLYKE